jgi:hypothetical protein
MTNQEEFNYFVDQLLENAVKEFRGTEEYRLLQEKLDQMDRDCNTMLKPEEKEFADECFELIMQSDGQEESYVYRKALKDSVFLLKSLGVLA